MKCGQTIKIVVGGLALGLCFGWVMQAYLPVANHDSDQTTVPVVVAAVDLKPGTVLGPESLQVVQWPRETVPPKTLDTLKKVSGRIITSPVVKGEPILQPKLAPAGMRELRPVA